jgi:hypothetical protein
MEIEVHRNNQKDLERALTLATERTKAIASAGKDDHVKIAALLLDTDKPMEDLVMMGLPDPKFSTSTWKYVTNAVAALRDGDYTNILARKVKFAELWYEKDLATAGEAYRRVLDVGGNPEGSCTNEMIIWFSESEWYPDCARELNRQLSFFTSSGTLYAGRGTDSTIVLGRDESGNAAWVEGSRGTMQLWQACAYESGTDDITAEEAAAIYKDLPPDEELLDKMDARNARLLGKEYWAWNIEVLKGVEEQNERRRDK